MAWFREALFTAVLLIPLLVNGAALKASIKVTTSSPIQITHPWFFSLGMDSNLIRNRWETFDFHSKGLRTLAVGLSPAYMRLMGTDGDHMIFQNTTSMDGNSSTQKLQNSDNRVLFPPTNFTFSTSDWDKIHDFVASVGWRMLFGVNAQLRNGSVWDPTNALELLRYSIRKGYAFNMDFELGNEPDLWQGNPSFVGVTGQQLAKDFKFFRSLLDTELSAYFKDHLLVGPDVANGASTYLRDFLSVPGTPVKAVTFHQYYGGSDLRHLHNFTDPRILDTYKVLVASVMKTVRSSPQPNLPVWQGETSSTYSPPGNSTIGESYAAGFMLLDKMGLSASLGIELVIRQTFFGFWFALVGEDLLPRPNYWTSLLFKQLVSTKVLKAAVTMTGNTPQKLRVYAHCAKDNNLKIPYGAVVVYAMNLFESEVTLSLDDLSSVSTVWEYLLTPGDSKGLMSQQISLNGQPIRWDSESALPVLSPRVLRGNTVTLPAFSYAYYVLPDIQAQACTV